MKDGEPPLCWLSQRLIKWGYSEKRATLDDETNMFFFNSPVVNVDPGSLTTTRTIAHPHHFPWHWFNSVLFKLNSFTGGAGVAGEQRRIISGIKAFPFPLHLGFSNYGGEISPRALSPADKHTCTHSQTGTYTWKHEHTDTHTHTH